MILSGLEHARALEEKKELRRQCIARHVVIEAREERIFLGLLEHEIGAQARAEATRQARFAGAGRRRDDEKFTALPHAAIVPKRGRIPLSVRVTKPGSRATKGARRLSIKGSQ